MSDGIQHVKTMRIPIEPGEHVIRVPVASEVLGIRHNPRIGLAMLDVLTPDVSDSGPSREFRYVILGEGYPVTAAPKALGRKLGEWTLENGTAGYAFDLPATPATGPSKAKEVTK